MRRMAKRDRDSRVEHARRQDAARRRGFSSAYQERIARAQARYPGMPRRFYRGHRTDSERAVLALAKRIRSAPDGSQLHFTGVDRQPDGTFARGRFDLLPGDGSDITTTIVEPSPLWHEIDDAWRQSGMPMLGDDYFRDMLAWIDDTMIELEEAA